MKLIYILFIVIFSITAQVSIVNLFNPPDFFPNFSLIVFFLLSYLLSYEKNIFTSIFAGLSIDISNMMSFGPSLIAFFVSGLIIYYLKKNILKGGRTFDLLSNSLIYFILFYIFLITVNNVLSGNSVSGGFSVLADSNLIIEIFLDMIMVFVLYHIIEHFKKYKMYGFIQNIKISD